MCTPQIVLTIAGKIIELVIQPVVRRVGLPFHYKKNMKNLKAEMEKLKVKKEEIKQKVDQSITGGEEVDGPVLRWLDTVEKEVEEFNKDEKTDNENMQCFKFSCPNYISRYQMSKEAENKIGEVKNLTQNGNFSTVAHPKPLPEELQFSLSANYLSFESRNLVFNSIMEALKDSNVKMIGVYGTGGVGKTTTVNEVGKQVHNGKLFDEVVVAVVSQDANASKIQGQLADRLGLKLNAETEVGRAGQLWNRLDNGKKNLIILDDVWQELDLTTIGIPFTDGNKGCKVVMTSRKQDVWKNMQIDVEISIQILTEPEAWVLLKKKVGNSIDSPELRDIADAVCKECRGLPVAILAVGAALKGKEKYAWKNALEKLKKSMLKKIEGIDPKLYNSLKLSYDWLESMDAKSCFLLCCLFPEDAEISIDDLVRHCIARRLLDQRPDTLEEARDTVRTVVHTLKTCSLLLDGRNEYVVKMHDVIRDVAISIAEDEKAFMVRHGVQEWPEKSTCESSLAISLRSKTIHEVPNELRCPQLHTLLLQCSNPLVIIPDMCFGGMEKLTVLSLNKIRMLRLPSSLPKLVNLRMIYLNECKLNNIAILKDLKNNLEILSLRDSNIEVLPSEIGQLTRLRLLDLGNCNKLIEVPRGVLSNLSCLEELYMLDGFDQWEATTSNKERSNVSLVELRKLTQLTTLEIQVPNLMLLPKDLCFENLVRFKISMGDSFEINEDYSRIFKFKGVSLKDEFNVLLERAEVLDLKKLEGLQEMHHDRGHGEGSLMQSYRLDTSRYFNKLTVLRIEDCKLKYLFSPSCAKGLLQLQELNVRYCTIMEEIVGIEGEKDKEEITSQVINFSQLKYMKLEGLPKLISFYPKMEKATTSDGNSSTQSLFNEKVDFPLLEDLHINTLPNIIEIWDKQLLRVPGRESNAFCQLQSMTVSNCENMMNVVRSNMLPQLQNLKNLSVRYCPKMEMIVLEKEKEQEATNDDFIMFPQLITLHLESLMNLKSFCSWPTTRSEAQLLFNHQVDFPLLEYLEIYKLPNITEIWDKQLLTVPQKESNSFSYTEVYNCENMMNVVRSNVLPRLQNLKNLNVHYCPKMEVIVLEKAKEKETTNDDIIVFPQLVSLRLGNLMNLKSFCNWPTTRSEAQPLFNHQVVFPALKSLHIENVPNITEIRGKELLTVIERELKSFCQLTSMWVSNCEKMVNLVPSNMIPQLQNLKELRVSNCSKMEAIVLEKTKEKEATNDDIILFPHLTTLRLRMLMNLKSFYSSPTRSEAQPLFNCQVVCPALESLHIIDIPTITEIRDKELVSVIERELNSFCQLTSLWVSNCEKMVNVIPSNMVPQLQNLKQLGVYNCPMMEAIVLEKTKEKEATNDDIILFPQLTSLVLHGLMNLKSFYWSLTRFEAQPLFNHQVAFPKLEDLYLNCVNSGEIHLWNVLGSEISLKVLRIEECDQESTVVSSRLVQRLQNLDKLIVRNCSGVTEVFQLEGLNVREREGQHQHGRPLTEVRMMELDRLPQLRCLWNKDLHGILGLENLQYLVIKKCSLLRRLFTCSTAMVLQQLKVLYLESCTLMEQVIATNEGGHREEVTDDDEIEFPKLEWLILKDLSNLNSFCSAKNCNFNFPSLKRVVLKRCPNMETFTYGQLRMSKLLLSTRGSEGQSEDLNKYLMEQPLLKGEESSTMDENDYEGEERRFSDLYWLRE